MNSRIEKIKQSINSPRLKLNLQDTISHFGIVIALIGMVLLFPILYLWDYFYKGKSFEIKQGIIIFILILLVLALLFFIIQYHRLKFKVIKTNLSKRELLEIINEVGNELEWIHYYYDGKKILIAKTRPRFSSGSWGEQIVIILNDNEVKVNSICDPDRKSSLVSMGRNKKNENLVIEKIKNANEKII